jgi:hypothetical protein
MLKRFQSRYLNFALLLTCSAILPFSMLWFSGLFAQVMPMNDVLLYGWWLQLMQQGEPIFGVAQPFVYPYLSLIPMWLAQLLGGPAGILVGWCALVALLNAVVIGFLTAWGRGARKKFFAAWFWLGFLLLLGPAGIARIDAISVSIALIGVVLFLNNRTFGAITLFTLGAWIKIWPVALAAAAYIADQGRKTAAWAATAVVSLAFLGAFFLGGNSSVLSFVSTQNNRGIQIESVIAMPWLWAAKFGLANAGIYYDKEIITNQVSGDWVAEISSVMTLVMAIAVAITIFLGFRAFRSGAKREEIFAAVALTAVLDLIVFNKVGSPQFMAWIAVPTIALILVQINVSRILVLTVLTVALLTNFVYPVFYMDLMALGDTSLIILTLRNALLVALLVWANIKLANLSDRPKS